MARPPRLHLPPHQGGNTPSISTSDPLNEIPQGIAHHDAYQAVDRVALEVVEGEVAEAAETTTTTTPTTTKADAHHDANLAVDRVAPVAAAVVAAAAVAVTETGSLRSKAVGAETVAHRPHR